MLKLIEVYGTVLKGQGCSTSSKDITYHVTRNAMGWRVTFSREGTIIDSIDGIQDMDTLQDRINTWRQWYINLHYHRVIGLHDGRIIQVRLETNQ